MVNIEQWMDSLTTKLKSAFGQRLLFVGLQGSYRRGEADEDSDIDAVVILDTLSLADLNRYKSLLAVMPEADKCCGFISGRQELSHWPKHELFQFVHDTRAYHGSLDGLAPTVGRQDIIDGAKTGASGIYHLCCHACLHGEPHQLRDLYKGAFFVLLAVCYLRHGKYPGSKAELFPLLTGVEQEILSIGSDRDNVQQEILSRPDRCYDLLLGWSAGLLQESF